MTIGHPAATAWWVAVARYGQPWVQRLLLMVVAGILVWRHLTALAVWLGCTVVAENVVAPLAKLILVRARPHWEHPIAVEHSLSYPSGHATAAGMLVVVVTLLALATLKGASRWAAVGVAVLAWLVISADRVFLGGSLSHRRRGREPARHGSDSFHVVVALRLVATSLARVTARGLRGLVLHAGPGEDRGTVMGLAATVSAGR